MRELFVYYRVATERVAAAQAQVRRLQAGLVERHAGLQARLLRRPDAADGRQTWMETYACPAGCGGVSQAMQDEIERSAAALLQDAIDGPRHCEVFEPVP